MFQKLVPLNSVQHANKKIKALEGYQFASQAHVASLMIHEFTRAAPIYPIVFLDDGKGGYFPYAMLGLDLGENLFVEPSGRWQATYIPAVVRRYPFALAQGNQPDQLTVCIDEGSVLVNDSEGDPIFTANGQPAPILDNAKRYLSELQQMEVQTHAFCRFLVEQDLLTPLQMRVSQNSQANDITGCHMISEEKLNKLTDEQFIQLRARGFLPAVYAHLLSLGQAERLVALKDSQASKAA